MRFDPDFDWWFRSNASNLIDYPKDLESVQVIAQSAWEASRSLLVSSKAAEAPGDQAAKVRDMCYQIPAKGGYPLVAAPAAPSERGDERKKFEQWAVSVIADHPLNLALCQNECHGLGDHYADWVTAWAYSAWLKRAGLSSQEGK